MLRRSARTTVRSDPSIRPATRSHSSQRLPAATYTPEPRTACYSASRRATAMPTVGLPGEGARSTTRNSSHMRDITFQLSLDLQHIDDAVKMARLGVEAGVQAIEAGTILILSEG